MNAKDIRAGMEVAIVSAKYHLGQKDRPLRAKISRLGDNQGHPMMVFKSPDDTEGREYRIHGRSIVGLWSAFKDEDDKYWEAKKFQARKAQIENDIFRKKEAKFKKDANKLESILKTLGITCRQTYSSAITINEDSLADLISLLTPLFKDKVFKEI
jgi:hypothetical protein